MTKRSYGGIIKYLNNIVYEETRDHVLAAYLLTLANKRMDEIGYGDVATAIRLFCLAPKKWQLPWREEIFFSEMRGYAQLVKEYGPDVAKGGNIIEADQKSMLLDDLKRGFAKSDLIKIQHGLKGLQKLKCEDLEKHRYWLYEQMYDYMDAVIPCTEHSAWDIVEIINTRVEQGMGIGYHELNALADAIAGEPVSPGLTAVHGRKPASGYIPALARNAALKAPKPAYPLGIWPPIPIYAQDNHTYRGKSLLRRFPEELEPGATQEHLDFRLCGAYYGVAWRTLAYSQFESISVPWGDVRWPKWLIQTVKALWY
jgi:hypothetical protein